MKPNWQTKKLEEVSTKPQYGWTTKADKPGLNKVKLLRTTDITKKIVDWETVPTCTDEPSDISKYLLNEGDILISRAGSVGVSYLVQKQPPYKTVFASYLIRFRLTTNPKYLKYYLDSPEYWNFITEKSSGIALKNVNASKLADLHIPIPDEDMQNRIAQTLDSLFSKLDSAEADLEKVEKQLEVYRQAVLKQAFKSKNPNWKKTKIGDVFEVFVGATPSRKEPRYWNGNINWVSSGEVQFCRVLDTRETITQEGYKNSSTRVHPKGTILLGMIGQGKTRGQAAILDIDAATNQNIAAIEVSRTKNIPEYLYFYLQYKYLETRMVGSGNNQKALNKMRVKNLDLILPPRKDQIITVEQIERDFSIINAAKELTKQSGLLSTSLRQSILKKAFEGSLI